MGTTPEITIKIPNSAKVSAIIWWVLGLLFLAGIFNAFFLGLAGIEVGEWQYGVGFLCLIASATSIVMAIIYTKRSSIVKRIQLKDGLLAQWTYTAEEWEQYARKEHAESKREKRTLFMMVTVISVIIGGVLIIVEPNDWLIFLPTIIGIIIISGGSALLAVWLSYRRNYKHRGEVFVAREALIINGVLHVWKGMGCRLTGVDYQGYQREIPVISFAYTVPARHGSSPVTVRVPVPEGREEEALKIAMELDPNPDEIKPDLLKD